METTQQQEINREILEQLKEGRKRDADLAQVIKGLIQAVSDLGDRINGKRSKPPFVD